MKRAEYYALLRALENLEKREKQFCERYCELNPADRKRREGDRTIYLLAVMDAKYEIRKLLQEAGK